MVISSVRSSKIRGRMTSISVLLCQILYHIWFQISFKLLTVQKRNLLLFVFVSSAVWRWLSGNLYHFEYVTASPAITITITSSTGWANFRFVPSLSVLVFPLSVYKCLCRLRVTNYFLQHQPPKCRRVSRAMGSTILRLFFKPAGLLLPQHRVASPPVPSYSAGINRWGLHRDFVVGSVHNTHVSKLVHAYITTGRRNVDRPMKIWSGETVTNKNWTSFVCWTVLTLLILVLLLYFCSLD
jgi:hypothetical protein